MPHERTILTEAAIDVARENLRRGIEGATLLSILYRGTTITTGVIGAAATRYFDMPFKDGQAHTQRNYLGIAAGRLARAHRIHGSVNADGGVRRGEEEGATAFEPITNSARRIAAQAYRGEEEFAVVLSDANRALNAIPYQSATRPLEQNDQLDIARQMVEYAQTLPTDKGTGVVGTAIIGLVHMAEEFTPVTLTLASSKEQRSPDPARGANDVGTNYMGFALSKVARVFRQKIAPHEYVFPGEVSAEGALAVAINGLMYVAAFSGDTEKNDVRVAAYGLDKLVASF